MENMKLKITKEIKDAVMDLVMDRINFCNDGFFSGYRIKWDTRDILTKNKIEISNSLCVSDDVKMNGVQIATIKYKYSRREINCSHRMLRPQIIYL